MSHRREFLKHALAASVFTAVLPKKLLGSVTPEIGSNGEVTEGIYVLDINQYVDLQSDGGAVLLDIPKMTDYPQQIYVTRDTGPKFYSLRNYCTHSGCGLNAYNGSYFYCQCHGSEFSIKGSVLRGPAGSSLKSYPTVYDSNANTLSITIAGVVTILPVEISSLLGTFVADHVVVDWSTASEIDNAGFFLDRMMEGDTDWSQVSPALIPGKGTTSDVHHYSFADRAVRRGAKYLYRLRQVDNSGAVTPSQQIEVTVPPAGFELSQNYPNPFSSTTQFTYALPHDSNVKMMVRDLAGREIRTLVDAQSTGGEFQVMWDGKDAAGVAVHTGTYVVTMVTNSGSLSRLVHVVR